MKNLIFFLYISVNPWPAQGKLLMAFGQHNQPNSNGLRTFACLQIARRENL